MFVVKRNQIIVTALIVMIAIAGYLNYTDRAISQPGSEIVFHEEIGDNSALVPNEESALLEEVTLIGAEGEIGTAMTTEVAVEDIDDPMLEDAVALQVQTGKIPDSKEAGAAVFVNSSSDTPFFVQAKLEREQIMAKRREMLTELINNKNLEKDKRAEAADELLTLQKRIEKEAAAEAMIEAKGFKEVYVRIDDQTVDVIVYNSVLSEAEIAQIEDVIRRKTGASADQIRISPLKR